MTRAPADADLLVWPENTYERELGFTDDDRALRRPLVEGRPAAEALGRDLRGARSDVLVSGPAVTPRGRRYYVSMLAARDGRLLGVSAKRDRTPLGEYVPFGDLLPFVRRLVPRNLWMLAQGPHRLLRTSAGVPFGVYICYEALLESSAREYARDGAKLLVNQASDIFARGVEPEQTLRLSALRAIENRRWVVRASVDSAFIDPAGRVAQRLPPGEPGLLTRDVPLLDGRTVYQTLRRALYALGAILALAAAALRLAAPADA
jgi:apolipoprotein N-acyltransferase